MNKLKVFLIIDWAISVLGLALVFTSGYFLYQGQQNGLFFVIGLLGSVLSVIGLFLIADMKVFHSKMNRRRLGEKSQLYFDL